MTLRRDQILVTVAAVVWLVGTAFGTGLVGATDGVDEQGEGLFSDSATLIAPHGPAFSIWSLIYVFLVGYVVWQWLPRPATSTWARVTRLPAAASLALNGIWLLLVYADLVTLSVVAMAGIVVALGLILRRTAHLQPEGWGSRLFVSVTFGLYLGWIAVATCANIASWLVGLGVPVDGTGPVLTTILVLAVVVGLTALLAWRTRQPLFRTALAAAVAWGLTWVAVGRFVGDLESRPIAYAAGVAVVCVVGLWALVSLRAPARAPARA